MMALQHRQLQQRPVHASTPMAARGGPAAVVVTGPTPASAPSPSPSASSSSASDAASTRCSAASLTAGSSSSSFGASSSPSSRPQLPPPAYVSPSLNNPALLSKTRLSYRGSAAAAAAAAQPRRRAAPLAAPPSAVASSSPSDGLSPATAAFFAAHEQSSPPPPPITKSDADFAAMGVEFVTGGEGVRVAELNDLFERVGFPRRDPERLALALEHTHALVWVRATRQSRLARLGQLLGFARATSDGALSATIWDVAVLPAWQRSGLGRAVVERLTRQLVEGGVSTITLYAEPKVVGMYRKLGFVEADQTEFRGLAFQRRRPQPSAGQQKRR